MAWQEWGLLVGHGSVDSGLSQKWPHTKVAGLTFVTLSPALSLLRSSNMSLAKGVRTWPPPLSWAVQGGNREAGRTGALDTCGLRFHSDPPLTSYVSLGRQTPLNLTFLRCRYGKDDSIAQVFCEDGNGEIAQCPVLSRYSAKAWVSFLPAATTRGLGRKIWISISPVWGVWGPATQTPREIHFLQLLRAAVGHKVIWTYFHILLNRCLWFINFCQAVLCT